MKKVSTLLAALLIGLSGAAVAQKQEPAKPAAAPAAPAAAPAAKADAKADAKAAPAKDAKADAKKEPMDLNSATDKELASLPKIGEAKAKAIIKGRPWGGKDELVAKKILTKDEYEAIKEMIIAKQPEKKEEPKKEMKKEEPKKDAPKK
jgi:DNA uptake protein ComE-like DNA-binding protein